MSALRHTPLSDFTGEDNELIRDYVLTHLGNKGLNLNVVENDGVTPLYHISTNGDIPYFEPRFSTKIYPNENTQIPRTSTSPSIGECMQGYGPIHKENLVGGWGKEEDRKNFNGIYYVYKPIWKFAIQVTSELVGDVKWSREHWLLCYKPSLYRRPAAITAQFFVQNITTSFKGTRNQVNMVVFLKVDDRNGVLFAPNIHLKKGFYRIELLDYRNPDYEYISGENTFIEEIEEGSYMWSYALRIKLCL